MAKAAPLPIFRALHQSPLHRVAMYVAQLFNLLLFTSHVEIVVAGLPERTTACKLAQYSALASESQPTVCHVPAGSLTPAFLPLTLGLMEVRLTPDQEAFIRRAIETGRFHRAEDAVEEALSLWEERERTRAEIIAAVDVAEDSLARGEGCSITTQQSMRKLASEVKQRGRARLAAERKAPR